MLKIYIAGLYTADTPWEVDQNIETARQAMAALLRMGHAPFCPHTMTARFERTEPDIERETYLETDLVWLRLCDAILLLPHWRDSAGSVEERRLARDLGLDVYYSLGEVPDA